MNKFLNILTGIMMCLVVLASVRPHSKLALGIGPVYYTAGYTLTALALISFYYNKRTHAFTYTAPILYLVWALWGIYRGQFEVISEFVLNQYFHGILFVIVPVCIFLFANPDTIIRSFQILNIFNITFSLFSFKWNYNMEAYCFAFTPFYYFYLLFITKIPTFWRYLTALAVCFVLAAHTNGSAFIKTMVSFAILIIFLLPNKIRTYCIQIGHWGCYMIPIVLLYLGLTGRYNVFNGGYIGSTAVTVVVGSEGVERIKAAYHADTRTFIYEEMLASMLNHQYFWMGRTPARGYNSPAFSKDASYTPGAIPGERFNSEVAHLNTWHWLGIIGLILITFVYLQGSCLALYFSNNIYVKCIALEVAFQWLWGWVENNNQFLMLDVMIFVLLAICYSPYFREMSNLEFEMWFKSIFRLPTDMHDYNKYQILKMLVAKHQEKSTTEV